MAPNYDLSDDFGSIPHTGAEFNGFRVIFDVAIYSDIQAGRLTWCGFFFPRQISRNYRNPQFFVWQSVQIPVPGRGPLAAARGAAAFFARPPLRRQGGGLCTAAPGAQAAPRRLPRACVFWRFCVCLCWLLCSVLYLVFPVFLCVCLCFC